MIARSQAQSISQYSAPPNARGVAPLARHDGSQHSVPTLLVASGRGGSGTSLLSTLFAVSAAGDGRRVLLVDADDFVGPLSVLLGVLPSFTWQDLRGGSATPESVAIPISTTLTLVAGGAPRTIDVAPNMSFAERRACMRRINMLGSRCDLVVIDCGSRLDVLSACITPHSGERLFAITSGDDSVTLAATFALCKAARARHGALPLDLIVNKHDTVEANHCFNAIDSGVRQFLGTAMRLGGAVPTDTTLDAAVRAGMPFSDAAAGSPAAIAAHDAVLRALTPVSHLRSGT